MDGLDTTQDSETVTVILCIISSALSVTHTYSLSFTPFRSFITLLYALSRSVYMASFIPPALTPSLPSSHTHKQRSDRIPPGESDG